MSCFVIHMCHGWCPYASLFQLRLIWKQKDTKFLKMNNIMTEKFMSYSHIKCGWFEVDCYFTWWAWFCGKLKIPILWPWDDPLHSSTPCTYNCSVFWAEFCYAYVNLKSMKTQFLRPEEGSKPYLSVWWLIPRSHGQYRLWLLENGMGTALGINSHVDKFGGVQQDQMCQILARRGRRWQNVRWLWCGSRAGEEILRFVGCITACFGFTYFKLHMHVRVHTHTHTHVHACMHVCARVEFLVLGSTWT